MASNTKSAVQKIRNFLSSNYSAAYEIARGSVFASTKSMTLTLKIGAITIDVSGDVEIEERKGNQIRAKVSGPRFDLVAKGFDRNRDLKIRTVRRAVIDAEDV